MIHKQEQIITHYWVTCEDCGRVSLGLWHSEIQAVNDALAHGWHGQGATFAIEAHYCPACWAKREKKHERATVGKLYEITP